MILKLREQWHKNTADPIKQPHVRLMCVFLEQKPGKKKKSGLGREVATSTERASLMFFRFKNFDQSGSKTLLKVRYSERSIAVWHSCTLAACTWGPVVQWLVQRFWSERLRVRSRRSATFTPSTHVRRQSLPVWPPTLNKILFYKTIRPSWNITDLEAWLWQIDDSTTG